MVRGGQRGIILSEPLGLSEQSLFIPDSLAPLLMLMDGTRDIGTLKAGFELRTGMPVSTSLLEKLLNELDNALLLENERFAQAYTEALQKFRSFSSRSPTMPGNGCPSNAQELGAFLQQYLLTVEKEDSKAVGTIRGLISPHIDFARGGPVYAKVWSKAADAVKEAELIIVLGTDHTGADGMITLTRQNYETPWGVMITAQDVVDEMVRTVGDGVFQHELHHRNEHSVEAAAIWLHYLLAGKRCNILPILCGSFQQFIDSGRSPSQATNISATIEVLQQIISSRRTVAVAAADLAHIGPVFGDRSPVDIVGRANLAAHDQRLIEIMSQGDAEIFFEEIRSEGDQRRICGMPPIYLALSVLSGCRGLLTGYAQCPASEDGTSLVSICGMVYT